MPSLNETFARIRAAHLLVRSIEEWDTLSDELLRAYDLKDNEKFEMLRESFVAAWKSVTRNLLTDTMNAIGITVSPANHPWGVATLELDGRSCEPLLCSPEELAAPSEAGDLYGWPRLRSFEAVMAGYDRCLISLLWQSEPDFNSAYETNKWS
ncbi:hypothetical protein [Arthrobacter sp. AZCC_0090]|uniref:hypothetical protein n=1 Tax=Arthrobacter sp. AZCC_0090 TaxID=2735881 RepID=UPI00162128F8|nr:hypothetical protein [Arthrobacter sp. AZCC_0090]MBB6404193.1 hypothetical protein [Arthrobacter sp. AZCC_0090]